MTPKIINGSKPILGENRKSVGNTGFLRFNGSKPILNNTVESGGGSEGFAGFGYLCIPPECPSGVSMSGGL